MNKIIKKGTKVKVIAGKDLGKTGEVIKINNFSNSAIVKGINMVKKHLKASKEKKGGIFSKENFIHISNLKNLEIKDKKNIKESKK